MVWGCMCWNGVGVLTEVKGIMNGEQYCEILDGGVVESFEKLEMPEGERTFQQDMEKACLAVTNLRWQTIIIGHSWLTHHNPEVDWACQSVTMSRCPPECQGRSNRGVAEDNRPEPGDAIYAMFIPPEWAEHHIRATGNHSGWPRKRRRLRLAGLSRTWCQPNTMTSETSSLRKPLMNSHHRRYGTTPLTSHLGLNSLAPGHSPCPLQNRRSLTTSSRRTLQMATSIHLSPPWEPLCSSSKRRMACFALCRTIGS